MQGSYRIAGGIGRLTSTLAANLSADRISFGTTLLKLIRTEGGICAELESAGQPPTVDARRVVLALPPRIAQSAIDFSPSLPDNAHHAMGAIPTWMAGQAKIVSIYDRPTWRENGLSGDAMSHRGPMVEIHDASPHEGGPYALFGFVGVPAEARLRHREQLLELTAAQLQRLFGPRMAEPMSMVLQDWAHDPQTATAADTQTLGHHPAYGLPPSLKGLWDNRLFLGSTEIAPHFGGFLEGALEASENVFAQISTAIRSQSQLATGEPEYKHPTI
jgi:monoamine oxidase